MTDAPTIRRPLAGSELTLALSGLEDHALRERRALEAETDPILYSESLLSLAGREERGEHPELAARYYSELLQDEAAPAGARERARRRLDGLRGEGDVGVRAEYLLGRIFREATDPSALLAMTLAGAVFRGVRVLSLARSLSRPAAGFLTRGFGARLLAGTLGYAAEATVFPVALRAGNLALGRSQDWSASALGHELGSSFLTLGALRAGGVLPRFLAAENTLLRPFAEQVGMFGGILLGHQAETLLGLRARSGASSMLVDGLATLLQFNLAGRIQRGLVGSSFSAWERGLDARAATLERLPLEPPSSRGELLIGPRLAAIGPESVNPHEVLGPDRVYMTHDGDGGGSRATAKLLLRAASLRIQIAPPDAWHRRESSAREYLNMLRELPSGQRATMNEIALGIETFSAWAASPNHFLSAIGHRVYAESWNILREKFSHVQTTHALEENLVEATQAFARQLAADAGAPNYLRYTLEAAPAIVSILDQARLAQVTGSARDMKLNEATERVLAQVRGGAIREENPHRATFYRAWLDSLYTIHGRGELVAHEAVAGIKALERELAWRGHQRRVEGKVSNDPSLEFYPQFWKLFRDALETSKLHGIDFKVNERIAFLRTQNGPEAPAEIREAVLKAYPFYVESQIAAHSHHPTQLGMMIDVFTTDARQFRGSILLAKNPEAREQYVESYVKLLLACRHGLALFDPWRPQFFARDLPAALRDEMAEGLDVLRARWTGEVGDFQVRALSQYWSLAQGFSVAEGDVLQIGGGANLKPLVALASSPNPQVRRAAEDLLLNILNRFNPDNTRN